MRLILLSSSFLSVFICVHLWLTFSFPILQRRASRVLARALWKTWPMLPDLLARYAPSDAHESAMTEKLRAFLESVKNPQDAFSRELAGDEALRGHVTGSAWIVNENRTRAVILHHAKLNKWVQPGGHCDDESDVLQVALREAREETGLEIAPLGGDIFDIDVHAIPEYWNTPSHFHYDIRFLFQADDAQAPILSSESRAVRWATLREAETLANSESVARMIRKTAKGSDGR